MKRGISASLLHPFLGSLSGIVFHLRRRAFAKTIYHANHILTRTPRSLLFLQKMKLGPNLGPKFLGSKDCLSLLVCFRLVKLALSLGANFINRKQTSKQRHNFKSRNLRPRLGPISSSVKIEAL